MTGVDARINGGRGLGANGHQQLIVRSNPNSGMLLNNQSNDRLGLNTIDDKLQDLGPTPYNNGAMVKGQKYDASK